MTEEARAGQRERAARWISAMAAVAVAGLIIGGLLISRAGTSGSTGAGGTPLPDFYGLAGQSAPSFTLSDLNNRPLSLSDFRGERVLLNFWYVACPGCAQEMPDLEQFYAQTQGQHFVVLGINIQDDAPTAARFLQQLGITYPVAFDTHDQVFDLYHLSSTPSSVFIDSRGVIRGSVSGPLNLGQLQSYFRGIH